MSMPDLWSPAAMVPRERPASPQFAVVPRERVYGHAPLTGWELIASSLDQGTREAIATAWAEGYRAAELVHSVGVSYEALDGMPPSPMMKICMEVARKHRLRPDELRGPRREKEIVVARHEAMWRCRGETGASTAQMGRFFGNRDHSTVVNAIKRHEERMAKEAL